MTLPNIEEIKEQKLVPEVPQEESETSKKTEETEQAGEETQEPAGEAELEEKPAASEVPASYQKRINELVYSKKSAEEKVSALEQELAKYKQTENPASEAERVDQNARNYLRTLIKEVSQEVTEESRKEQEKADKALEEEISNVSAIYPDFNEKEVLKVMEEFGIENVETAYKAWKKMTLTVEKTKEETKKEIISKPKNPSAVKTTDDFGSKFSEDNTKGKSLWELAEMAKREAGI